MGTNVGQRVVMMV